MPSSKKLQATTTALVVTFIVAIVGFVMVEAFATAWATSTMYPHAALEGTVPLAGCYNTTAPAGTVATETWITYADGAAAPAGNYSIGKFYVAAEDSRLSIEIPASTWTFTYYGVANVTGKAKFYTNITEVNSGGAFVGWIEEYAGKSGLITDANSTLTGTHSIANYTFADITANYIKVEYFVEKQDATMLEVKLLIDGLTTPTKNTVVIHYQIMPALERALIELIWIVIFASIALVAAIKGFSD